jgi:hypothetical protein
MNKQKGSEWRKWDLHFHTPSSYDYKDKSITDQEIIDNLIINGIQAVAITDHHVIDAVRIRNLQNLGRGKITVLPGIEFLSDSRGDEPIHFIGIFSEKSDMDFVWKQIESRTDLKRIQGERKKLNEVYCHLLDTIKLIKDLKGIVSIHAGTKSNGLENITHSLKHGQAQKEDIARAIDIFELGSEDDIIGYKTKVIPFLRNKIDKNIPMIICSDNHDIKNYHVKQNLWIKADPTFEGLKQIIFEPEQRVKIQKEKPDFKEEKLVIDEVRFISNNFKFTKNPICLNDNLNVIIGGKSSGKSILLYNIAKTLLADKEFLKKENIESKYDFRSEDSNYNFEIKTKGGFKQLMYRVETENSIIPTIKYIPQNYLVKLAEPEETKSGNALNKIIRDLINEDSESKLSYDNFISKVQATDRKRENLIDNYFELQVRISQLESQLMLKTNKDILEGNICSNTMKVEQLNKGIGMSSDQISKYNELQNRLEKNSQNRTQAINDYKKINDFNSELLTTLTSLKSKKELVGNSLNTELLKDFFNSNYVLLGTLIENTEFFISNFETTKNESGANSFKVESTVSNVFKNIKEINEALKTELEPYLNNEEVKKQIEQIIKSISEDKEALQSINQLNKEIIDNRKALEDKKDEIFKIYEDNHHSYVEVINALKIRTVDLEKDSLKIEGLIAFNFPKFRKAVVNFSDGRSSSYSPYTICDPKRDSLFNYQLTDLISELKIMFASIAESESYVLSSKSQKKSAIKILLHDYFFDYWKVEFKNDKLGKMSTGKASFVILMLIVGLSKSKAPILIDQPEDNLDNRSITTDLVEYLKNKKLERQIILVTHNANVVVNADAENIIVANQKGQGDIETSSPFQFDYIVGSLENTFPTVPEEKDILKSMGTREHIADIVEGGKLAFQKREEKYGFKAYK